MFHFDVKMFMYLWIREFLTYGEIRIFFTLHFGIGYNCEPYSKLTNISRSTYILQPQFFEPLEVLAFG